MNQNEIISGLIANSITTTAYLANEICIQTKGEFILPEIDYLNLVKDFQIKLTKRLMPIQTSQDLKDEVYKYIKELLDGLKESENVSGGSSNESESGLIFNSEGKED